MKHAERLEGVLRQDLAWVLLETGCRLSVLPGPIEGAIQVVMVCEDEDAGTRHSVAVYAIPMISTDLEPIQKDAIQQCRALKAWRPKRMSRWEALRLEEA